MSATPMDIARSAVAHQMAGNRAWHQPAFLVMNSAVNFADQMATNAAEKGNAEMYDAYAAVTSYLSESRDRLTARYPVVNLDDLATDVYRVVPIDPPAPQDHGPLAAVLSDRTLAKVLSRPAHVPSSLVVLDAVEALAGVDIPAILGEHWNWWHPNHVATCMCGTALDVAPGQAVYPSLHRHQADLITSAFRSAVQS